MGNCLVCKSTSSAFETAKLIDTRYGTLKTAKTPAKASELMLEYPGNVVASSEQIGSSKRVSALRADDEIEAGKVYLLFPVCRVNRRVTEAEIMLLEAVLGRKISMRGSDCRVAPAVESPADCEHTVVVVGKQRRWCPILESIAEIFES